MTEMSVGFGYRFLNLCASPLCQNILYKSPSLEIVFTLEYVFPCRATRMKFQVLVFLKMVASWPLTLQIA